MLYNSCCTTHFTLHKHNSSRTEALLFRMSISRLTLPGELGGVRQCVTKILRPARGDYYQLKAIIISYCTELHSWKRSCGDNYKIKTIHTPQFIIYLYTLPSRAGETRLRALSDMPKQPPESQI